MGRNLGFPELIRLLQSVFAFRSTERDLTILVDLPTDRVVDTPHWKDRRRIATEWYALIQGGISHLPFTAVNFCAYDNVGSNNNDLPEVVLLVQQTRHDGFETGEQEVPLRPLLSHSSVVISVTEFSATAPLKLLAKELGFRGATLPGFSRGMLPTLLLDYEKIHQRVMQIKERLDRSVSARIQFATPVTTCSLFLDLRYRGAHASGGIIRENGLVANLPSGEAYIVPYEGEKPGEQSRSAGVLPVQFDDEIVRFTVEKNRVVAIDGEGEHAEIQRGKLAAEWAYGNLAELGIGVLGEWGVKPVGSTLLDEKLGLHIAFGRSDHFGGATGPKDFRNSENVIHLDWVYSNFLQPNVRIPSVSLDYENGSSETIILNGQIVIPPIQIT